jgi:hypothetical protein
MGDEQVKKVAEATAVPFADSAADTASSSPLPGLAVGNKPAPGQTGPKGLAPRTNYSRVNTGSPSPVDAGMSSQKGTPADPQSFLPPKVAHSEVPMSGQMTPHMTIQQMIKAAAEGAQDHAAVTIEAARQLANQGEPVSLAEKTAAPAELESISTAYVEKFASAVEYVLESMDQEETEKEAAAPGPGTGPNALTTLQATSSNNEIKVNGQGQSTPAHQPPKHPGTHKPSETPHGPANALDDNASMKHPKQPVKVSSVADGLRKAANARKAASTPAPEAAPAEDTKEAAAPPAADSRLVDYFLGQVKQAEDAINPAKISAGAAVPPDTSASGESGGAPAGGQPQGPTSLIGSNEAAINYTKGQAKAPVKPQLAKVLTEPALSAAHDKTLNQAFDHTGQAGVKISHSVRSLAARAVLEKMAEEADDKKDKKKESTGGGASFTAPPVGGVAGAGM